jgi:hypothetical protein
MPRICRVFNEFCPGGAYLIIHVERAGGPKLARLRRRFPREACIILPSPVSSHSTRSPSHPQLGILAVGLFGLAALPLLDDGLDELAALAEPDDRFT